MRETCRQLKQNQRGAAMVAVLCILAVFMALALALLLAASTLVSTTGKEIDSSRCKIGAVAFSDEITADMAEESSELNRYVREQISSGAWQSGEGAAKEFESVSSEEGTAKESGSVGSEGGTAKESKSISDEEDAAAITVSMYWERPEGLPKIGLDGSKLYMTVTYTRGKSSHRLKSEFELSCSDGGAGTEEEKWQWQQIRRS